MSIELPPLQDEDNPDGAAAVRPAGLFQRFHLPRHPPQPRAPKVDALHLLAAGGDQIGKRGGEYIHAGRRVFYLVLYN